MQCAVPDRQALGEEIANGITHGLGAVLSVAALVAMLVSLLHASRLEVLACTVYGISLIVLYLCSTLYHALSRTSAMRVFRVLDHSSIYLLIAGTYTPFTLITLRGVWGWWLFAIIWTLAGAGIVFKCFFAGRLHVLSTVIYVLMGWLAAVAIRPLWQALSWQGFAWVLAGGLFYTVGVVFFASKWKYSHTVWHLFVLAGSGCHFHAVYRYVLHQAA